MANEGLIDGFLAEVSEFLGDGLPAVDSIEDQYGLLTAVGHDGLIYASEELVAETAALMPSWSSSPREPAIRPAALAGSKLNQGAQFTRAAKLQIQAEQRKKNATKRRIKYNKKVEDERQNLKKEELELTAELSRLQAMKSENKWVLQKTKSMPVWRAIATRQLQGRLKAEAERRRLQDLVNTRNKLLQELGEKMLQHLQSGAVVQKDGVPNETSLGVEDVAVFDKYLAELDSTYDQIDDVHHAWGVKDSLSASFRSCPKRLRHGGVECVENLEVQLVPFNFQQTGDAIWQSMRIFHQRKGIHRQHYRGVPDPENTIAVKVQMEKKTRSGGTSSVLLWLVIQRRIEPSRTVLVWRMHSQDNELNVRADESGWLAVLPTDASTRCVVGMPTALFTFVRFIPGGTSSKIEGEQEKAGQFMQLAEASGHEGRAEVVRMMESLLLDDSRSAQC